MPDVGGDGRTGITVSVVGIRGQTVITGDGGITKGGGLWLPEMTALDCDVLGLDWTASLGRARAAVGGQAGGPGKALQGNLDPNVLFAPPEAIAREARAVLDSFGCPHTDAATCGPTHIFNLGHGISQFTPPEHVTALVEAVHGHSRALRRA